MKEILLIAFAAIITENFIFSRFLGICPFLGVSEKPSTATGMGLAVMFVMTVSSALTWLVYEYILVPSGLEYIKTIAFILIIAALVQIIEMFLKKFIPALYQALGIYLPLITTNCAVLGAALLNVQNGFSFLESVVFGLSAAIGFTVALLIFAGVRERLRFSTPPAAFKGIPILLVSAGLIAMAFSGFAGITL